MSDLPDCPSCGDNRSVHKDGDRNFFCTLCKVEFDDNPDEGGDYSINPTKRIERQEAWAARQRERRHRRAKSQIYTRRTKR